MKEYNVTSTQDLTKKQYEEVCKRLESKQG